MKIIFDTFAWIEYFNGSDFGKIAENYLEKNEIITPVIVLLELSCKAEKNGMDFSKNLNFIKIKSQITGISEQLILEVGKVYNKMRKERKNFGLADAVVLVTALMEDAKVLTGDEHFKGLDQTIFLE